MAHRYDGRDERNRGEFSGGGYDYRRDGDLGGYYARDTHRDGYGDDYARDDPRAAGAGARGDFYTSTARPRGSVSFRGKGPKNWRRSDERILEDVNDRLTEHDGIDATHIEVAVENGEVTLSGTVDSRWTKRMAEDVAEHCAGVVDVHNRLKIERRDDEQTHVGKASE